MSPIRATTGSGESPHRESSPRLREPANPVAMAIADRLITPRGLAVNAAGDVIIAEAGGHRVWLASASGTLNVLAGIGTAGFTGDGGPANAAQLCSPSGVAIDSSGVIWIADSGND